MRLYQRHEEGDWRVYYNIRNNDDKYLSSKYELRIWCWSEKNKHAYVRVSTTGRKYHKFEIVSDIWGTTDIFML